MTPELLYDGLIWTLTFGFIIWGFYNVWKILQSPNVIPDTMPDMVTRAMPTSAQRWACRLGMHVWVSRVELGAEPEGEKVNGPRPVDYFFEFSAPVCKHCPKQLQPRM